MCCVLGSRLRADVIEHEQAVTDLLCASPLLVCQTGQQKKNALQAPPGAGKSTGLPVALLQADPPFLAGKRIVLLQPRRLAVVAVARRIAALLGEHVGNRVGVVSHTFINVACL